MMHAMSIHLVFTVMLEHCKFKKMFYILVFEFPMYKVTDKPVSYIHCVSKNDTDVAHYNFNAHQLILVIFGTDVAERVCYRMVICYPISPN